MPKYLPCFGKVLLIVIVLYGILVFLPATNQLRIAEFKSVLGVRFSLLAKTENPEPRTNFSIQNPYSAIHSSLTQRIVADLANDFDFNARDEQNRPQIEKSSELKNLFISNLNQLLANRNLYVFAKTFERIEKSLPFSAQFKKEFWQNIVFPRAEALLSFRSLIRPPLERIFIGTKLILMLLMLGGFTYIRRLLPPPSFSFQLAPLRL